MSVLFIVLCWQALTTVDHSVLYDRLTQVPPSPELNDRHPLPPVHSGSGLSPHHHHGHQYRDHREDVPMDDRELADYVRTHPNVRMVAGPDGRPVPVQEGPMGPGMMPSPHTHSRHIPSSALDPSRQLPPLNQLAPPHYEHQPRSHGLPHSHSPHMPHPSASRSHSGGHTRSHSSSSRSRAHQSSAPYPPDAVPPPPHMRSPSMSGERDRSRRHEVHERPLSHGEHHSRQYAPSSHSPTNTRASVRSRHTMSQAELDREAELAREDQWEYEQRQIAREQYERELRERDRENANRHSHRIPTPPFGHQSSRQALERPGDYHDSPSYRSREEPSYHREVSGPTGAPRLSRSGTPGSGSGSGTGDAPPVGDSRSQFYDRDRARSYNRPPPHEEDLAREDHRLHSRDRNRSGGYRDAAPSGSYTEARKRNHHEMEVDGDAEPETPSVTGGGGSRKRIHQENTSARGADSQEEEEDVDA